MNAPRFHPETGLPDTDSARFTAEQRFEVLIPQEARFGALIQDNLHMPRGRYEVEVPPISQHVLIFGLRLRSAAWDVMAGGRKLRLSPRADEMLVLPAGLDLRFTATQGAERILHLHLNPGWLADIAGEAGFARTPRVPLVSETQDGHLTMLFRRMAGTLQEVEGSGALIREHAAMLAGVELLRMLQGRTEVTRHRIAPARLRAVLAYIEDHLAEDVTLAELAAVARLSRFHFARSFRAEMGSTPQRYVNQRRVERAKRLMLEQRLALADIALACGFAHQAHFTTAFRRAIGTTPGRWRQERLA